VGVAIGLGVLGAILAPLTVGLGGLAYGIKQCVNAASNLKEKTARGIIRIGVTLAGAGGVEPMAVCC
jgi:hypothetical protein